MQLTGYTAGLMIGDILSKNAENLQRTSGHLSSGKQVQTSMDNPVAAAIATRRKVEAAALAQSMRNINDGVSMLETAAGGLGEIGNFLQRARELAVQAASGVTSSADRTLLQGELDQILSEVSSVSRDTKFNWVSLLNGELAPDPLAVDKEKILDGLKTSWMQQGEKLITGYFGLTADQVNLSIVLDTTPQPYIAAVTGTPASDGKLLSLALHIDPADFAPANWPNGGTAPVFDDRVIAHELTHAVMGRTMNFAGIPNWFKEGAAEFIPGADERLAADLATAGGGAAGANAVANAIGDGTDGTWTGTSIGYSAGYAAVRYLHQRIKAAGGTGISEVMAYMHTNPAATLDTALQNIAHGAYAGGIAAFVADFKTAGNGSAYIQSLNSSGLLANADTGAVGGADADGGAVRNSAGVVPDIANPTVDPTAFNEIWPAITAPAVSTLNIVSGDRSADTLTFGTVAANLENLRLTQMDVVNNPQLAIKKLDDAIQYLSGEQGRLGALQSRLGQALERVQVRHEKSMTAVSRVEDADFAKESADYVRAQILSQAGAAVLSQVQQLDRGLVRLLG